MDLTILKTIARPFEATAIGEVEGGGVYALAAEKRSDPGQYSVLYVGRTSDIKSRLQQHLMRPPVAGVTHFFTEPITNEPARAVREEELIRHCAPLGNMLAELPRWRATEASYLAVRALWHRHLLATVDLNMIIEAGSRPVPEDVKAPSTYLLKAIEESEGMRVESLDAGTVAQYLRLLYDTMRNRAAADLGYEAGQGQQLLSRLRGTPVEAQ